MAKLTIIDSYDYVVDFIENIVEVMNSSLSKFGKYSVSNGEIAKNIIKNMCLSIENESYNKIKNVTEHMLVFQKNSSRSRKLAIELDDEIEQLTNNAIAKILQEGYKKIPSRTMFFRESLRTYYDFFSNGDGKNSLAINKLSDVFAEKILKPINSMDDGISSWDCISSIFHNYLITALIINQKSDSLFSNFSTAFFTSVLNNYKMIDDIIEHYSRNIPNSPNAEEIRITELIYEFVVKATKTVIDTSNPDNIIIKECEGKKGIEISTTHLYNLIEAIEPDYNRLRTEIKVYFLFSLIVKEFYICVRELEFLYSPNSRYIKKNAFQFSDLYLMTEGLTYIDNMKFTKLKEQKTKIKKLFIKITNYKIRQNILIGIRINNGYLAHSPTLLFLQNTLISIMVIELFIMNDSSTSDRYYFETLQYALKKNLPQFKELDNDAD